jgi:hypothetical protein
MRHADEPIPVSAELPLLGSEIAEAEDRNGLI